MSLLHGFGLDSQKPHEPLDDIERMFAAIYGAMSLVALYLVIRVYL